MFTDTQIIWDGAHRRRTERVQVEGYARPIERVVEDHTALPGFEVNEHALYGSGSWAALTEDIPNATTPALTGDDLGDSRGFSRRAIERGGFDGEFHTKGGE